jgi:hypothetical protein
VNSPPPKPEVILTNFFAEPTKDGYYTRLVIGTSRTVGSAKKFVRITSGFGGGEFTKTLRKVCTCQKLKFANLLLTNWNLSPITFRLPDEKILKI